MVVRKHLVVVRKRPPVVQKHLTIVLPQQLHIPAREEAVRADRHPFRLPVVHTRRLTKAVDMTVQSGVGTMT